MRICVVGQELGRLFVFDQAKALKKAGHEVVYIALDIRSIRRKRKFGIYESVFDGIEAITVSVPIGKLPAGLQEEFAVCALRKGLKVAVDKYGAFDIIHSHFFDISYVTAKAIEGIQGCGKFVITEHSSSVNKETDKIRWYVNKQCRKTYAAAVARIAVSSGLARRLENNYGYNFEVLGNLVETELFRKPEEININCKGKGKQVRELKIITVGGLKKNKRVDRLIYAMHYLPKRFEWSMEIVGDGPEKFKLKTLIEELNETDRIKLIGLCNRQEIASMLTSKDAFVQFTERETYGVSVAEALCAGVSVFTTDDTGAYDIMGKEDGIICDEHTEDVNKCLIDYLDLVNSGHYNSILISDRAVERFSEKKLIERLEQINETSANNLNVRKE